ncbi:unnamed protein product, partial [Porites lobata]
GRQLNESSRSGNPASHYTVRQYLIHLQEEQAKARVTSKQAFPLKQVFSAQIPPSQRYLYARDLAFSCLEFFSRR